MRLSQAERQAISQAGQTFLPSGSKVWLFGSRTDDRLRGGDIDLLIETPRHLSAHESVDLSCRFVARLHRMIEERRIDVVITDAEVPDSRPIVVQARRSAIPLVTGS